MIKHPNFFNILEQYNFFRNENEDKFIAFQIGFYFYFLSKNEIDYLSSNFGLAKSYIKIQNQLFSCIKVSVLNKKLFQKLELKKISFIKVTQTKTKLGSGILERVIRKN